MHHLAAQVVLLDQVMIRDSDGSDTSTGQVEQYRRPQSPSPDHEYPGGPKPGLADQVDSVDQPGAAMSYPGVRGDRLGRTS